MAEIKLKIASVVIGSTEGGGTDDYTDLDNKPQINSVVLSGNKSASDLGLATAAQGSKADSALQPKQSGQYTDGNMVMFDGNGGLVDSGKRAMDSITRSVNDLANYYLKSETYTKTEVDEKMVRIYKPAGNATLATLGSLDSSHEGFVYNMTEDFTITSDFVEYDENTPKSYAAGSDVAVVNVGTVNEPDYKYNVLGGNENKADFLVKVKSVNLFDKSTTIDGIIKSDNGKTTNAPSTYTYGAYSAPIPVKPDTYYCISGWKITQARSCRCLAADGTTILKVLAAESKTEWNNSFSIPVPDGSAATTSTTKTVQFLTPHAAAYFQINVATQDIDARGDFQLEEVGDTYNPSFTPTDYHPYGKGELVFDPDVLPPDIPAGAADGTKAVRRKFKLKVLFVGSSHLRNTCVQFPWIGYKSGIDVEVGNVYVGSLSLQWQIGEYLTNKTHALNYFKDGAWTSISGQHYNDAYKYTDWDYIVIQRSATDDHLWTKTQEEADEYTNSLLRPDRSSLNIYGKNNIRAEVPQADAPIENWSHDKALQYILDLIRNNANGNPTVVFTSGFADANEGSGHDQTDACNQSVAVMKERFGLDVLPLATAVRNARNTYLRLIGANDTYHNLCYDSQHLDHGIGCFVASITAWEFILRKWGQSVINMPGYGTFLEAESLGGDDFPQADKYTEPTPETMSVAKACAMCACDSPEDTSQGLAERFKWAVTQNLAEGVTSSNTQGYCGNGDTFATTLSGETTVTVTMDGVDITSTAYNAGEISIDEVTGDIVITAEIETI